MNHAERFAQLSAQVVNAAYGHTVKIKDYVFWSRLARIVAIVLIFTVLQILESSPKMAVWLCLVGLAGLLLDLIYTPDRVALRHAVRAGKLTELAFYMREVTQPPDEDEIKRWQQKATDAGADELDQALANIALQPRN